MSEIDGVITESQFFKNIFEKFVVTIQLNLNR